MIGVVTARVGGRTSAGLIALALALTGCAQAGHPVAGEPDVRKLDVGNFDVSRRALTGTAGSEHKAVLESMRMSAAVPAAVEVDSALITGRGYIALTTIQQVIDNHAVGGVSRRVLDDRQFVTGFMVSGSDKPNRPNEKKLPPDASTVQLAMLRFPDDESARKAAQELEDTDFSAAPENQKVSISKYSDAQVHWRPAVPSMGVYYAKGPLVLSGFVQRPAPDRDSLVDLVEKVLDAASPRMAAFKTTPLADLEKLPQDADGLLSRVIRTGNAAPAPDMQRNAVLSGTALMYGARDAGKRRTVVTDGGVDAMANFLGSWVLRARNEEAAKRVQEPFMATFSDWDQRVDPPRDVPGATCRRLNPELRATNGDDYRCFVTYGRYLAMVFAPSKQEAQQKAAAQYALLANSL